MMQIKVKTQRIKSQSFVSKASGLSLGLTLVAGLALAPQLSQQVAWADSVQGDGVVITHDPGAQRKAMQRAQKAQVKALKQQQRLEVSSIPDKHTRHKIEKQEKQNLKAQQKFQKQWLKQHQWSQQHQ